MRSLVTERRLSAASAALIGGLLHSVMTFAVQEEMIDANPVVGLARPLALVSRDRMLDDDGLRLVWHIRDQGRTAPTARLPQRRPRGAARDGHGACHPVPHAHPNAPQRGGGARKEELGSGNASYSLQKQASPGRRTQRETSGIGGGPKPAPMETKDIPIFTARSCPAS